MHAKRFKHLIQKIKRRKIITTRVENRERWLKFKTLPGSDGVVPFPLPATLSGKEIAITGENHFY